MYSSLMEYHVPETEAPWTDILNTYALMGAREIGEIGVTVTAAVADAVYNP